MQGHASLLAHDLAELAAIPRRRARPMGQGVLFEKMVDTGFDFMGDGARSTWAEAIQETLGAFLRKALDPFSEGGIGKVEGFPSGFDAVTGPNLPDSLGRAKDAGFLGLLHKVIQGGESIRGKWAA